MASSEDLQFYYETISDQSLAGLAAFAPDAWRAGADEVEKMQIQGLFISRAMQLGDDAVKMMSAIFSKLAKADNDASKAISRVYVNDDWERLLERDRNGGVACTMQNYRTIMNFAEFYKGVNYNVLKGMPERHVTDGSTPSIRSWTDADTAESCEFIENNYHIYNDSKHRKALAILFTRREYNPVENLLKEIEWDGEERISNFLTKWMKSDDTPYVREVSRLIFAGGINRLYNPGCKFDDVPVLIGTKQGEGKSTIVRWLAMCDNFYTDVSDFEGQKSIEQLQGAWICEIGELLALTKTKEQEAVKAFITRQSDKYRRPYAEFISDIPRRCIFIGTTNNERFLRDKTGNRRFYPVYVHSSGYELFDYETECKAYIEQCWAEAREKYKQGKMPAFADKKLADDYKAAQEAAMEDDWRVGALTSYLDRFKKGERVCCRQIMREAFFTQSDIARDPTPKESAEIGVMMSKFSDWEKLNTPRTCGTYGKQRGWIKVSEMVPTDGDLPW